MRIHTLTHLAFLAAVAADNSEMQFSSYGRALISAARVANSTKLSTQRTEYLATRSFSLSLFLSLSLYLFFSAIFLLFLLTLRYACSQVELNIHFVLHFLVPEQDKGRAGEERRKGVV